jgi:Zinc finger, C2H2 type.
METFTCEICGKVFYTRKALAIHIRGWLITPIGLGRLGGVWF